MEIIINFGACATFCLKGPLKMVIFALSPPWNSEKVNRYDFTVFSLKKNTKININLDFFFTKYCINVWEKNFA